MSVFTTWVHRGPANYSSVVLGISIPSGDGTEEASGFRDDLVELRTICVRIGKNKGRPTASPRPPRSGGVQSRA
jgi:hypothetical protein